MRKSLSLKAALLTSTVIWVVVAGALSGCSLAKGNGGKVRDLDFAVVGKTDIPEELRSIIAEKKTRSFKLTYNDNESLYIVVGYGPQSTGGCNIAVEELHLTDNSVMIDTELTGPAKEENPTAETSYPYVVVKTEHLENPMVFQ